MSDETASNLNLNTGNFRPKTNYSRSDDIAELVKALVGAQATMGMAAKDATNPHFGSKYADLASCFAACKEPLAAHGLAVLQPVSSDGPKVTVTTLLAHVSGQWISCELTLTSDKNTPQGIGSSLSYARRYCLSSLIGLASDDDDGNLASGRQGSHEAQQEVAKRKIAQKPRPWNELSTGAQPEAANPATPNADFKMLAEFATMKKVIGEKLYYGTLKHFGFQKSSEIPTAVKGREVFRAMGQLKKCVDAAAHGEVLPEVTEVVFENLPAGSHDVIWDHMRDKLVGAGGTEVALEEMEAARQATNGESRWAFYLELKRRLDGMLALQSA